LAVALFASKKLIDLAWAALAILGIYLILPVTTETVHIDTIGVALALGAGACWAAYILFGQRAVTNLKEGRATALGMLIAMLVVVPIGIIKEGTSLLNAEAVPMAFAVAILSSAVPYSLEMISLKRLPARTFGILMSLEPARAALFGFMILSEELTFMQWGAVACVIFASLGSSLTINAKQIPKDELMPQ
jgi:inner membrane transporter RhtA